MRPKRSTKKGASKAADGPILAETDFRLGGPGVHVTPERQPVPKNTPTIVRTELAVADGVDPVQALAELNPNYRVRGTLAGPTPVTLDTPIGQPFSIPPFAQSGEHRLTDLRVVDTTPGANDATVDALSVDHDTCYFDVIEQLLVSEVRVEPLDAAEIAQAGIAIDSDSYSYYNFTLALGTISDQQTLALPVAFPRLGAPDPRPIVLPTPQRPGLSAPLPDFTAIPVLLEPDFGGGGGGGAIDLGGEPIRIPGVIVIPGQVGLLHEFFEAIVIVSNGAPRSGTPLRVSALTARVELPDNGTPDPSDDPLAVATTQTGGAVSELAIHGLGADGAYGTPDDATAFAPGESGQASFLLEGLEEGLHEITFHVDGTLEGMPAGPIPISAEVPGAVLVRDPRFAVTFTHPSVVRAGQEFDFGMTLTNSSPSRDIEDATIAIDALGISGASLLNGDTGYRHFGEIAAGTSKTVTWRLRSNTTGQVTASYTKVDDEIEGGLVLSLGVGDRNVPLSPDSLVLPSVTANLPGYLLDAARALLGQAWSLATAPASVIPSGVTPVELHTVVDRSNELAAAGLRVRLGESPSNAAMATLRDWLGEGEATPDSGFADAMRDTPAGYAWFDAVGRVLYDRIAAGTPAVDAAALHRTLVESEMPRSGFASAFVTQPEGAPLVGARLVDASGHMTGFLADPGSRAGDLATGASARLLNPLGNAGAGSVTGDFVSVSRVENFPYTLELNAYGAGTVSISLALPAATGTYRQVVFSGLTIAQGDYYRVAFRPYGTNALRLEKYTGGSWTDTGLSGTTTMISEPAPRVVSVVQLTPEVVDGGDRYGRFVGVYFSKPMAPASATVASRYTVGGGELVATGEPVGSPIGVLGSGLNFGGRVAVLSLDAPVGPYIHRTLTVRGVTDTRGLALDAATVTRDIEMHVQDDTLSPGGYVTGRVLEADGSTVANASVINWEPKSQNSGLFGTSNDPHSSVTIQKTTADGRYAIDYVRNGSRGPVSFEARSPANDRSKSLSTTVAYAGQHLVVDLVFIARGSVAGTIHNHDGSPAAWAFVQIVSNGDVASGITTQANQNGQYRVDGVPVGACSVYAVSADSQDFNASGVGSGSVSGPGAVATVDVTFQNVSGAVGGQVIQSSNSGANTLAAVVRAYADLPGYGSTLVGYAYAFGDGHFRIDHLPIGPIHVTVTNYSNDQLASTNVTLTTAQPEITNLVLTLGALGAVSGRVVDDLDQPIATAVVGIVAPSVATDGLGYFDLPYLAPGTYTLLATDRLTGNSGTATVTVQDGQVVEGVKIVIARVATISGTVRIVENGATRPLAGATVTVDGFNRVTTNGLGHYTLGGVVPNSAYTLRVVAPGSRLGANLPLVVGTGASITRDVTLRPGTLHGTVYQPNGTTPAVATVTAVVTAPNTTSEALYGLLESKRYDFTTGANGQFDCGVVNPGAYVVTASNTFLPKVVAVSGTVGPNGNEVRDLSLVDTLAGTIEGTVTLPDGSTAASGVEVRVGGENIGSVSARTDGDGHYRFAEIFPGGWYDVTATDLATGFTKRERTYVQHDQDVTVDLALLGKGTARVHVVDAAGSPVTTGSVRVEGSDYPRASGYATIASGAGGVVTFDGLSEGSYAVSAEYNGVSGRATAVVSNGGTADVTVTLQPAGTVTGHVLYPESGTPAALCDVKLWSGPWVVGVVVTSDADADLGSFRFENVVAGDYSIDVFDNTTGRYGRTSVHVSSQGEVVVGDVNLLRAGTVQGVVTSNATPVDHALVRLSSGRSGLYYLSLNATTTPDGHFLLAGVPEGDFTISAVAPTGESGGGTGALWTPVGLPLQTSVNIHLSPSATIAGTVHGHDGAPYAGASVALVSGPYVRWTSSLADGTYRFVGAGLGTYQVQAFAPGGYDRGRSGDVVASTSCSTVTADVTLDGVGEVTGVAHASNGSALSGGTVALTNDVWGSIVSIYVPVQPNGAYAVHSVPAGAFALRLTVPNDARVGVGTGTVAAGQSATLDVTLESAGSVAGVARQPDGTTPSAGANVTLTLERSSGPTLRFYANTTNAGAFRIDNVPLGTATAYVNDTDVGGQAIGSGTLATNGQVLDLGTLTLDVSAPTIVSVSPADGATSIATDADVVVTFSEPILPSTVTNLAFQLHNSYWDPYAVPSTVTLSPSGTTVTVHPTGTINQSSVVHVSVSASVADAAGNPLGTALSTSYSTVSSGPPGVYAWSPALGAVEQSSNLTITAVYNQQLDPTQDVSALTKITPRSSPSTPYACTAQILSDGHTVTFTPVQALPSDQWFDASINGVRNTSGGVQTSAHVIGFATHDTVPPTLTFTPADGAVVTSNRPTMHLERADSLSGLADWQAWVDGVSIGALGNDVYSMNYVPPTPLAIGAHTIRLRSADVGGNVADETHTFTIEEAPPNISSFTIDGRPAVDGLAVTSTLRPSFAASYAAANGVDTSQTHLYLGYAGGTPAAVSASVTGSGLTYQPAANLAEGAYTAELVVVDTLGTTSSSGVVDFTIDADAPEIATVTPDTSGEHGGTTVTLTGQRLLNTNNSAPTVTVGGFPAVLASIDAGTPNTVVLVTPASSPGDGVIKLTTDRGTAALSGAFTYTDEPGCPFPREADTSALWHFDGPGNLPVPEDSIYGAVASPWSSSSRVQGRFGAARTGFSSSLQFVEDVGRLYFPTGDLTVEAWLKGDALTADANVFNVACSGCGGGYFLTVAAGGGVAARLTSTSGVAWNAESPGTVVNVTDGSWHHVAMTVSRLGAPTNTAGDLVVYVDGVERARTSRPAGFDRISTPDPYGWIGFSPLTIDELRVSSSAHTPEAIALAYAPEAVTPNPVPLNPVSPRAAVGETTVLDVGGYNLANVTATYLYPNGSSAGTATVLADSSTKLKVAVDVPAGAAPGDAILSLVSPTGSFAWHVPVFNVGAALVDTDTVLLMPMDVDLNDYGPIHMLAGGNGGPVAGRIGGAFANVAYCNPRADWSDSPALSFPNGGFTFETWFKTTPSRGDIGLFGKGGEYQFTVLRNGTLHGVVYDTNGLAWECDATPATGCVIDNAWHHLAFVPDLAHARFSIYVDGVERAWTAPPSGFTTFKDVTNVAGVGAAGPYATPAIDDLRVSNTAHSAERILSDSGGDSNLLITSATPRNLLRDSGGTTTTTAIQLAGRNLGGISVQVSRGGVPVDGVTATVTASASAAATVSVDVDPSTVIGPADLVVSGAGNGSQTIAITIAESYAPRPIAADTRVLYHFDRSDDGYTVFDSGPFGLNASTVPWNYYWAKVPGRYGSAVTGMAHVSGAQNGVLAFPQQSFTVDMWVKYAPGSGWRSMNWCGTADNETARIWWLGLSPSDSLWAEVDSSTSQHWIAEVPASVVKIDDSSWHWVAMSVDEENDLLDVYVDGVKRAEVAKPTGFGVARSNPENAMQFYPGGLIDEVRVSASAFDAARASDEYTGYAAVRVTSSSPETLARESSITTATTTTVTVAGYGLGGVAARVERDGVALDGVSATVTASSYSAATVTVSVDPDVALGAVDLVVSRTGSPDGHLPLTVVEPRASAVETDTVLLWRLDDTTYAIGDSGPNLLGGSGGGPTPNGVVNGARVSPSCTVAPDGGLLSFADSSFTTEFWMKTPPVSNSGRLLLKGYGYGWDPNTGYHLLILPSGALQMTLYDTNGLTWIADTSGRYGATDDGSWHRVAVVLDRTAEVLLIYVDGVERARTPKPTGFTSVRTTGNPLWVFFDRPDLVVDEFRISSTAHSAQKIYDEWCGIEGIGKAAEGTAAAKAAVSPAPHDKADRPKSPPGPPAAPPRRGRVRR